MTLFYSSERRVFRCFSGGGAVLLAMILGFPGAQAQTTGELVVTGESRLAPLPQQGEEETGGGPQQAQDTGDIDEIVVTGSRIRRNPYDSTSPISVLSTDDVALSGRIDTASLLYSASVASGADQTVASLSSSFLTQGGPGAQTISLRGLGDNRTLVLLDGRRAGPSGLRAQVGPFDLNVLPRVIISRVEILKDGASSIYGSDAVAGVINIITRNIEGFEIRAGGSAPFAGSRENVNLSAAWGKSFSRGSISIMGNYGQSQPLTYGDRDFLSCELTYRIEADTGFLFDRLDPNTGGPKCFGTFRTVVSLAFRPPGARAGTANIPAGATSVTYDVNNTYAGRGLEWDRNPAVFDPNNLIAPNNFYPYYADKEYTIDALDTVPLGAELRSHLFPETEVYSIYAKGNYQLSDAIELYGDFLYNKRTNDIISFQQFFPQQWTGTPFFGNTNRVDPVHVGRWGGNYVLQPVIVTDASGSQFTDIDYYRLSGGLRGDFSGGFLDGWSWDVSGQYSISKGTLESDLFLTDSWDYYEFRTELCNGRVDRDGDPCVDYDFTTREALLGNLPKEVTDYLTTRSKETTDYNQFTLEAILSGELFELPAGPVDIAAGAQFRYDELDYTPDPFAEGGGFKNITTTGITRGDITAYDLFTEFAVPVVRDVPFVEELSLNLSARYTDIEEVGDALTYKAGLSWQINDAFRARASIGTSFRSPNLFEIFLNDQVGFASANIDICLDWRNELAAESIGQLAADNCAAAGIPDDLPSGGTGVSVLGRGGLGFVEPETADTWTAGLVFRPDFADLSVSVDYYSLEIDNQITQLGAANLVSLCYDSTDYPYPNVFCDKLTRNPADDQTEPYKLTAIVNDYINIAKIKLSAVDIEARYIHDFDFGRVQIDAQATYTENRQQQLFEGATLFTFTGDQFVPRLTGFINANLVRGDWTYTWRIDYVSETEEIRRLPGGNRVVNGLINFFESEAQNYHGIFLRKQWASMSLTIGVENLFDRQPPFVTTTGSGRYASYGRANRASFYDVFGRRFVIGFEKTF